MRACTSPSWSAPCARSPTSTRGCAASARPRDEPGTTAYAEPDSLAAANGAIRTLGVDLAMVDDCAGADLVHSHTWYANMAGHLAGLMHGIPHVVSAHSLEPMRPWKAEQLGGGYALSSWVERTAYEGAAGIVAVSAAMRDDVLRSYPVRRPRRACTWCTTASTPRVVPRPRPRPGPRARRRPRPAQRDLRRPDHPAEGPAALPARGRRSCRPTSSSCCAPAPPTPRRSRPRCAAWSTSSPPPAPASCGSRRCCPRPDVVALLTAATVFACPSIYEPLGIVNLEAMACETAVVATATGGIPEVVVDGETGWLVPIEQATDGTGTPLDPEQYVADLAAALNDAVSDPDRARGYGAAGRRRAEESFSWDAIAARTLELYRSPDPRRPAA